MEEQILRKYAITIANLVTTMTKSFGPNLDKWKFMLVSEPKIPFANETKVPNVTFTYKLKSEENAKFVLGLLINMLYGTEYIFNVTDNGPYLICYLID